MHRAGVDRLRLFADSRIGFQRHSAFRTAAGSVALHRFAHRAEILLRRLAHAHCPGRFVRRVGAIVAAIRAHRRSLSRVVCSSARSSFGFIGLSWCARSPAWPITQARASSYTRKTDTGQGYVSNRRGRLPDETAPESDARRRTASPRRVGRGFKKNGLPKGGAGVNSSALRLADDGSYAGTATAPPPADGPWY